MTSKLDQIRAKLASIKAEKKGQGNGQLYYPFWNMQDGQSARVRFLPNKNPDNVDFWATDQVIYLNFEAGAGETNNHVIAIPSLAMFGEKCPIKAEVSKWYKNEEHDAKFRASYWPKPVHHLPCVVEENPLDEDDAPTIRMLRVRKSIFNIIHQALMDPDFFHDMPTEFDTGTSFRIAKKMNGQWPDYTSSGFLRKESPLAEDIVAEVKDKLIDPSDYTFRRPSESEQAEHMELFRASVNGEPFDPNDSRWPSFKRDNG